jgi:hypothetical protein
LEVFDFGIGGIEFHVFLPTQEKTGDDTNPIGRFKEEIPALASHARLMQTSL